MGKQIKLKEQFEIKDKLYIAVAEKPVFAMDRYGGHLQILAALSSSTNLLVTRRNDKGSYTYNIHTSYGVFFCLEGEAQKNTELKQLLIVSFYPSNFESQNNAIKNGICISLKGGILISVTIPKLNEFLEFESGVQRANTNAVNTAYSRAFWELSNAFFSFEQRKSGKKIRTKDFGKVYEPTPMLSSMLDTAESYSRIVCELEERRALSNGKLVYTDICPTHYKRNDRITYRFIVDEVKKNFEIKKQVEITDILGNTHSAEIIALQDKGEEKYVDLLFNRQVDIDSFEKAGFINLSFSTVNRDVQLQAIEKIRKGAAGAKYMDDVLGRSKSSGFYSTDLSDLSQEYHNPANYPKGKFPPNPSQEQAIYRGIRSKDAFLVMGPPGTGKTTVILQWVKYFVVEKHMRVLVSSQNNKAVDNVIERILEDNMDIDVLRIGSEAKLQQNVMDCIFENKIKALRLNIASSARDNSEKLRSLAEDNSRIMGAIDSLASLADNTKMAQKALDEKIKSVLEPLYKQCKKLIKKYEDTVQSLENAGDKVSDIKSSQKTTTGIFGIFTKHSLSSNEKKIEKLSREAAEISAKYEECISAYTRAYHDIETNEFVAYREALSNQFLSGDSILSTINTLDEFGINNVSVKSVKELKKRRKLKELGKSFESGEKRALETIEVLSEWADEMDNDQNYALNEIIMQSVNLVGATCIGINSQKKFSDLNFDVTIIDEAGQIQIHNALVPMSVSNKVIMLGDHKQIPPTAELETLQVFRDRNIDTELYEKSLFEIMYDRLPDENKFMLDTQFRMPAEIADIISEWFYDGKYLSYEGKRGIASLMPDISKKPFVIIDTSDNKHPNETVVNIDGEKERYNDLECRIIVKLLKYIKENELDLSQVGVIAALKAQVRRIKKYLIKDGFSEAVVNEMVSTLDSFQGQERDIIIYSFTRSSDLSADFHRVGFLTELRRLNVAMSRCKKNLVVIGNMKFLSECENVSGYDNEEIEYHKTEKNFSEFIKKMINDVKEKDRGEIIISGELDKRLMGK